MENTIEYYQLDKITHELSNGSVSNIIHKATIDGKSMRNYLIILFHSASSERSWACLFCTNRFLSEIYYQKLSFHCYWDTSDYSGDYFDFLEIYKISEI